MRWMLELVSGPEIEVVELAQMKRELREFASVTSRDNDITAKIKAAREWIEDFTGRALVDETWRLSLDYDGALFAEDEPPFSNRTGTAPSRPDIYFPRSPVIAITSIATVDAAGDETVVAEADYGLREGDSKYPRIVAASGSTWSGLNSRITFRAGFADRTGSPQDDASAVPERFKQAMILWVKANYNDDPEAMKAAENLARPLRVTLGMA